uniref:Uncharacterized protein n=1 Tax=Arundo donax TaxID=35708 RepID=A0A0A8Y467_ARUDO
MNISLDQKCMLVLMFLLSYCCFLWIQKCMLFITFYSARELIFAFAVLRMPHLYVRKTL